MEFKKYNSIENAYQEKFIQNIILQGYGDMEYIVQEKVHGANLSFITNGEEILTAKRTDILADSEEFYNVKAVREKYERNVFSLFRELSETMGAETVTIFGELFGGAYPHPDVARDKTATIIQKGVFYTPSNDFFGFDILVNHNKYINVEEAGKLFEKHGFIYARTLFKGSLKECLAYPNEFQTTIPALYGLPEIEGNCCEGVVIRSIENAYMYSGARVIIKNKNEKWAEKKNKGNREASEQVQLSEQAALLCEEASKFVTENRLDNVISKIGAVTVKDFGKVLGMFSKDAVEDFLKTNDEAYNQLEKPEMKAITKFINTQAQKLVKTYMMNL